MLNWTRKTLLGCSAAIIALTLATQAVAQQRKFDIPAQDASTAVTAFALQAGVQISAPMRQLRGVKTPAVRGDMDARAALQALLQGTGLVVARDDGRTIVLQMRSQPAAAQDVTAAPSSVEELIVTGSNLRGGGVIGPMTTISREDLDRQGFLDVGQAIRSLPGNFAGGLNAETGAANVQLDRANLNSTSISSANLLGLGSGATLTLLNGHRLPVGSVGLAVDLSLIPSAAIQRVDVLADGASAIYGTDAVAGVVNVITRSDFNGLEARARYGAADGGLQTTRLSAVGGGSIGGLRLLLGSEYYDQDRLSASKRARASRILQPSDIAGASERTSYFASAQYELNPKIEINGDALYMQRFGDGLITTATSFTNQITKVSQYAASLGLKAQLTPSWDFDLTGTTNENTSKYTSVARSRTTGVRTPTYQNRTNYLRSAEAKVTGSPFELPGGNVQVAAGASFREEGLRSVYSPRTNTSRDVKSTYAELNVPLVGEANAMAFAQDLRLTLAARHDHYSDVGGVTVPKVAVGWTIVEGLQLTASFSKSFRAPSPYDLSDNYTAATLQVLDNTTSGRSNILYLEGTGAPLTPERAKNFNVGLRYEPHWLDGLRLGANVYDITYSDRITAPGVGAPFSTDIRTLPAQLLTRSPSLATLTSVASGASLSLFPIPLTSVDAIVDLRTTNVARTRISGAQLTTAYRMVFQPGDLTLSFDLSYIDKFSEQIRPNSAATDRVNNVFSPPRLRHRAGGVWAADGWTAAAYWNHTNSYSDKRVVASPTDVKAYDTIDATFSFDMAKVGGRWARGSRVILSASNLLDAQPPYVADNGRFSAANWDATNASIIGRFMSVELVKTW